jgi:peptide/nickel transport system permease protein
MAPLAYLIRRLGHTLFVLLGVSLLVFVLVRLGGDPTPLYLPEDASQAEVDRFRRELGFDKPVVIQYADFLRRSLQGNFGESIRHGEPAMRLIRDRLFATFQLTLAGMSIALLIALPVGVVAALVKDSPLDFTSRGIAMFGQCLPSFWLGIMLITTFSVHLRLLPAFGRGSAAHLILPAVTLGLPAAAIIMRLLRSSVLDVLGMDFVRTAYAKGLARRRVIVAHILRNAALPALTIIGLQLGHLLSGAIITETVFAYPGIGRLVVQAIANRDFPVVQAFIVISALIVVTVNLLVDLGYAVLDPRIRYG